MNSQDFLTLNLIVAGGFALWYFVSRGGAKSPSRLNLKAEDSAPVLMEASLEHTLPEPAELVEARQSQHSLNVLFNYNGHTWDAYEVLGVPAGAQLRMVSDAYESLVRRSSPESREFLETAYKAITSRRVGL